ncbi:caspase family protein [Spirosoma panaciterrae]|uniref:caspase family protein n=1 Tax=Spirosoma panaciterrae TaxID=496058 RepID=UPI000381B227|nr:caspase family protein [Spirosoma panaciterrae]
MCLVNSYLAVAAKWGLLIEIGKYKTGRDPISTERDVYYMSNTLQQQGFSFQLLQNEAATAASIRAALEALKNRCKEGDKVIIHYGGHGTQLRDQPGGDEVDNFDEALVPYDAPLLDASKNTQSTLFIRDDEIGIYLDALRKTVGPTGHVLILIDACYSGTMSRGQARLRTDNTQSVSQNQTTQTDKPKRSEWFEVPTTLQSRGTSSTIVMITGAEANQTLYEVRDSENKSVGPLALYFSQEMSLINEQSTYLSLFKSMVARWGPVMQNPTIEGNQNARLLGGDLVLPAWFTRIKLESQRFLQKKGILSGYTRGSEVAISITPSNSSQAQTVTGRVVEATPFESIIELAAPLATKDSIRLQTTLSRQAFEAASARVTLVNFNQSSQKKEVQSVLQNVPGIQLVSDGADWLIRSTAKSIELCRASDGAILEQFAVDAIADIPNRLTAYTQAKWMQELRMPVSGMQASINLVPVQFAPTKDSVLTWLPAEERGGIPVIRTNQQALLTVTNTGSVPFYFSIIDIQPNAVIDVPIPNNKYSAASLKLLPGQSQLFPLRQIAPPLGLETFKLILTQTPVELSGLVQTRGETVKSTHPLSQLLSAGLRGNDQPSLALDQAGMHNYQFWIDSPQR